MKVFIGADHAGFALKEKVKAYLTELKVLYVDCGNEQLEPADDYTDYAYRVAKKAARTNSRGILICNSGVGMCIAANKVKGVRAVNASSPKLAKASRQDNDSNVLCLGQGFLTEQAAKKIVFAWLNAKFSPFPRYKRRLNKIKHIENGKL